jgi:hypothetical protein
MNGEAGRKSCFEFCQNVENVTFEKGPQLRIIGPSALSSCESFAAIAILAPVTQIDI